MAHAIPEAEVAADKKKIAVLSGLPQTRLIYVDHVEYPYLALCLICVAQTSDSGRRACRTWHSVGTEKTTAAYALAAKENDEEQFIIRNHPS